VLAQFSFPATPPCLAVDEAVRHGFQVAVVLVPGELDDLLLAVNQGLTLAHSSAQLQRFVWDRGCA